MALLSRRDGAWLRMLSRMGAGQRIGSVLFAALRGWTCATVLRICLQITAEIRKSRLHHYPFRLAYLSMDGVTFWTACTFVVTAAATILFVLPFFLAVPWRVLVRRPWLVTVGPLLIVLPVSIALTRFLKAPVDSFSMSFALYGDFALLTCALSSTFVLNDMGALQQRHAIAEMRANNAQP